MIGTKVSAHFLSPQQEIYDRYIYTYTVHSVETPDERTPFVSII